MILTGKYKAPPVIWFIAVLLLVNAVFFRAQFANGFSILFGDREDSISEASLLEHWFNVLRGLSNWREPNYFYPYKGTLGYNDGEFLYGMIHSVFRSFGIDPLLSSELVNVTVKNVGFIAFYHAARRILNLPTGWALYAATLFTMSHSTYLQAGHAQLQSVSFAPLMALLIWASYHALIESRRRDFIVWGSLTGIFYAAWLLTGYYMAWFFTFFTIFWLSIFLVIGRKNYVPLLINAVRNNYIPVLAVIAIALAALVPFLMVYMPKVQETGMRTYGDAFHYTLRLHDIVNIGTTNIVFGYLYKLLFCSGCGVSIDEYMTGIAPILLLLLAGSFAWLWRCEPASPRRVFLRSIALTTCLTWVLCCRIGNVSGWHLIYHYFPGAKALRVVARYQIFLMAPIVALAVSCLADVSRCVPKQYMLLLCCVLLLEEVDTNSYRLSLNRAQENSNISVPMPPPQCTSFFVTHTPDQSPSDNGTYVNYPHNVDAMLIAELVHIPTLNGHASKMPSDWDFGFPFKQDYTARMKKYIARHHLTGVCRLDLTSKSWETGYE